MRENNFGKYLGFTCVKNTKEETIYEVVLNDNMLNPFNAVNIPQFQHHGVRQRAPPCPLYSTTPSLYDSEVVKYTTA